ncbi:MAG TPA: putative ABC exporter domain-containing protein, partial [Candidatus Dormibacteraeota bacterium]|nr:putative ABC exporter domain-containing protein [Candidatus Dormibacteraeota bacterium]
DGERSNRAACMNRALLYLWFSLLKGRTFRFVQNLRKPTSLIGFAAVLFCLGTLFHFRRADFFENIVRPATLIGCGLLMLCGSVFKGFLQRGLVFELPDIEFLFTSPFTRNQLMLYRLFPAYLYSFVQSLIVFLLLAPHLQHPLPFAACLMLFQIACFHISSAAAVYGGTLSTEAHARAQWMLLGMYFLLAALYLRLAWDLKPLPQLFLSAPAQLAFYPAVTLSSLGSSEFARTIALRLTEGSYHRLPVWQPLFLVVSFALAAAVTLWLLFRTKGDIRETSLVTSARVHERRLRIRQDLSLSPSDDGALNSACLPRGRCFHGVGAIIWKNLLVAKRSRRQLLLATGFTLIYTGFLIALRAVLRNAMREAGGLPAREVAEFDKGIIGMLACLAFFLQRAFPFDFRRDSQHPVQFRTFPVSPFSIVAAELLVPTIFCVLFQTAGVCLLFLFGPLEWPLVLVVVFGFPAVALGLNGVWNLHYLLSATRRAGDKAESASPVGMVIIVALSFLIFYPAGWAALEIGQYTTGSLTVVLGVIVWLLVQYAIDFGLLALLANLFQRFEPARHG